MKNINILLLIILFCSGISSNDYPIVMNKCSSSQNVVSKFVIPDLINLKALGFKLTDSDTIYDTGSIILYLPNINVYYVTKRDTFSVRYDGEIYKLTGYSCIDKYEE